MNSTAIIIPNWNGLGEVELSIQSLQEQSLSVDIIVVDNGSVDGSKELVRDAYPDVTLLPQPINLGFAGGVNVGIRHAMTQKYTYIGLFNSDAQADKDWARQLIQTLESDNDAAIATGLLLHGDGKTIDSTGDWYSVWGLPFPRGRGTATETADEAGYVFSASGGASIYRASLFEEIGLFDEAFFAYYEDVDISFRTQLTNHKISYNPKAIAYHERGSSSSKMDATKATAATKVSGFTVYQTFKNLPVLYLKNVPARLIFSIGPRFYLAYCLIYINALKNGNGRQATKGLLKSIALLPYTLSARSKIQKSRTATNDYIRSILWLDLPPEQTGLRKFRKLFTGK